MATKVDEVPSDVRKLECLVGQYRSLHTRAVEREAALKQTVAELRHTDGEQRERIDALLLEK